MSFKKVLRKTYGRQNRQGFNELVLLWFRQLALLITDKTYGLVTVRFSETLVYNKLF